MLLALALTFGLNAQTPAPAVRSISSGVGSTNSMVALGGIITISGTNLAPSSMNLGAFMGQTLPMTLGGVQVSIGGRMAPIFMVSPTMIVAQVPFEVDLGPRPVQVTNGTLTGAPFTVNVDATAPALFSDGSGGIVVKAADYSLVGAANPALPGEELLLYATGLGQTSPGLNTGMIAASSQANTGTVTAQFDGQPAEVRYSVAAPGFVGL
ncbi:MAG: IPT/TIG domain-containing protein [Bryobacteraceae bacterium]